MKKSLKNGWIGKYGKRRIPYFAIHVPYLLALLVLLPLKTAILCAEEQSPSPRALLANLLLLKEAAASCPEPTSSTEEPTAFKQQEGECEYRSKNEQVQLRHIEGKGVGYNQGYTTIQAFFTPDAENYIPMLDLRGHVFDDGKFAANVGVGLRYQSCWVYGIHAYYDYRQTQHFHYNQFALGLEMLGKKVDFRINGYLPIGRKQMIEEDKHKREFAFKGINAEVGVHLFKNDTTTLYGAIGPYYFEGRGRNAWGGGARFSATFLEHVRFEVSSSYDPVFKWIGQGQISLMYFFGPMKQLKKSPYRPCCDEMALRDRTSQWVDRNEIIVVDSE